MKRGLPVEDGQGENLGPKPKKAHTLERVLTACEIAVSNFDLLRQITQWMDLGELAVWRECSTATHLAWRKHVFGAEGVLRTRTMDIVERILGEETATHLVALMKETGALITGSTVLRALTSTPWKEGCGEGEGIASADWRASDVDVALDMTASNHDKVLQFLKKLRVVKHTLKVTKTSLKTGKGKQFQELVETLQKEMGPVSHHPVYYHEPFSVLQVTLQEGGKIDLIFAYTTRGNLWEWIKDYFDLDICKNAVSATSLRCGAPKKIALRAATLRVREPCCIENPKDKMAKAIIARSMQVELAQITCACRLGREARVKKYTQRGFAITMQTVKNKCR